MTHRRTAYTSRAAIAGPSNSIGGTFNRTGTESPKIQQ
jgi:hypothetical protein